MNLPKFHGTILQVNLPYSSSAENISRSSCPLNLEMEYKMMIRSFLIGSSKVVGRFKKRKTANIHSFIFYPTLQARLKIISLRHQKN